MTPLQTPRKECKTFFYFRDKCTFHRLWTERLWCNLNGETKQCSHIFMLYLSSMYLQWFRGESLLWDVVDFMPSFSEDLVADWLYNSGFVSTKNGRIANECYKSQRWYFHSYFLLNLHNFIRKIWRSGRLVRSYLSLGNGKRIAAKTVD
jgi:hypothetical protein